MALILIDVDGTLVQESHSEPLFIRYLLTQGLLGPRQLVAFGAFIPCYAIRFGRHVFKKNKAYLSGLSVTRVQAAAAEFVDAVLLQQVNQNLRQRLDYHIQVGDTLALLTGTPEFIARPLAERLSIPHVVATVCDQKNGYFTARPPDRHPFDSDKITAAEHLCRQLHIPLSDCVVYADSIYDLPLMERVHKAVAVTPDGALRAQARRRGWEIMPAGV